MLTEVYRDFKYCIKIFFIIILSIVQKLSVTSTAEINQFLGLFSLVEWTVYCLKMTFNTLPRLMDNSHSPRSLQMSFLLDTVLAHTCMLNFLYATFKTFGFIEVVPLAFYQLIKLY